MNLKEYLEASRKIGLTAKHFAIMCDLHHSTIKNYLTGKCKPRPHHAQTVEDRSNGKVTVKEQYAYYRKLQREKFNKK